MAFEGFEIRLCSHNRFLFMKFLVAHLEEILRPEASSCEILLQTERPGPASKSVSAFEQ